MGRRRSSTAGPMSKFGIFLSLAILGFCLSLVQSKHFLVETKDDTMNAESPLTTEELAAVIDALPEEQKESYNQASSDLKQLFQEEIRSEYGQDLDKMVESAKDGSMERLLTASLGENDYQIVSPPQCFSGTSTVETEQGKIPIGNLKLGDNVFTYTPGKGGHYTEFLGWLDRTANANGKFLKISTNSSSIVLTGNHLIFRLSADVGLESVFADQIEEGDRLVGLKGEETVVGVEAAGEKGIWTPLTMEGTLLVDGFLASSYASFPHHASQLAYAPIKKFSRLLLDDEQSQHQDGCRNVVKLFKKIFAGFRERNQAKKENPTSGDFSQKAQLADAGFSKTVEL